MSLTFLQFVLGYASSQKETRVGAQIIDLASRRPASKPVVPAVRLVTVVIEVREPTLHTMVEAETGLIARLDMNHPPSGKWIMTGLSRATTGGRILPYCPHLSLAEACQAAIADGLLYKNGRPRFFINDLDHGSPRVRMGGVIDLTVRTV